MTNKSKNKVVCILNYPSFYRKNIYIKMEDILNCDFYFGINKKSDIKKIDYSLFKNQIRELNNHIIHKNISWIIGSVNLSFKPYGKYILTGDYNSLSSWCILIINKLMGKKTYLWSHGWYGNERYISKVIKKLYFGLSNGVLLYGNYAKKIMISNGFNSNKISVIYNSLDYTSQLIIRRNLKKTNIFNDYFFNTNPTLIFIGRLTKVKKIHYLIKAQKLLRDKGVYTNVVLIGDGVEKRKLEKLVIKYKLVDNFWFYGQEFNEKKIGELIYNSNLCVSPGNVGLTAVHCFSYGTPVITHDNFPSQMPEFEVITKGITGDFFKENSVEDLSKKIEKWLDKPELERNDIREKCYENIDKYYNPNFQINAIKVAIAD